jgi:hypothetical protein
MAPWSVTRTKEKSEKKWKAAQTMPTKKNAIDSVPLNKTMLQETAENHFFDKRRGYRIANCKGLRRVI